MARAMSLTSLAGGTAPNRRLLHEPHLRAVDDLLEDFHHALTTT
jgi:hypothetical protein